MSVPAHPATADCVFSHHRVLHAGRLSWRHHMDMPRGRWRYPPPYVAPEIFDAGDNRNAVSSAVADLLIDVMPKALAVNSASLVTPETRLQLCCRNRACEMYRGVLSDNRDYRLMASREQS